MRLVVCIVCAYSVVLVVAGCTRADVLISRNLDGAVADGGQDASTGDASVGDASVGDIDISLMPTAVAMNRGASQQFTATVIGSANAGVVWSASGGTVNGSGEAVTYTAPNQVGSFTLEARSVADSRRSATATITVADTLVFGMAVPTDHPRLWWNAARLAQARAWFAANPFTPGVTDALAVATHAILSENPAECRSAIALALAIDPTGAPGDAARWDAEDAILVYDWCYAQWTQTERDTFVQRWNDVFVPLMSISYGGPTMPESDAFWAWFRNELEWGLTTFGENALASQFLQDALETRWEQAFLPHSSTGGIGGAMQEGSYGGGLALGWATIPLVSAHMHGRDLWAETAFFKSAVFSLAAGTTPAATVGGSGAAAFEVFPSNDDPLFQQGGSAQRRGYGDFMTAAANRWSSLPAGRVARTWLTQVSPVRPVHVRAVDGNTLGVSLSSLPMDTYLPGAGWGFARSSWNSSSTVVHVHTTPLSGTGHEHEDVGSWQLWRNGRWLSRESTGSNVRYVGYAATGDEDAAETIAHNTVLVDGLGYAHVGPPNPPTLRRLESTSSYFYAAVDVSAMYRFPPPGQPSLDVAAVSHVEREVLFLRAQEVLVLFDRLEVQAVGSRPASSIVKTFLAHFEQVPTIEDARHVTAQNGDQVLRLTSLVPAAVTYRVVNEGSVGQHRLEVDASGQAQDYFLHVLQARDASAANVEPQLTEDATGFVVDVGGTVVRFEKGMQSMGGSVGSRALLNRVQGIVHGEAGPVWEVVP